MAILFDTEPGTRADIRNEIALIEPRDTLEKTTRREVLSWIDSGVEICRISKPATPPKHLISYFVLVDDEHILLVDHINAELWLPTGGHVEQGEHPKATALREANEELSIQGEFLYERPLFLSTVDTVGKTAGHTDVCIWYALRGSRNSKYRIDQTEFRGIKWFHKDDVPIEHTDPHMRRFLAKLYPEQ